MKEALTIASDGTVLAIERSPIDIEHFAQQLAEPMTKALLPLVAMLQTGATNQEITQALELAIAIIDARLAESNGGVQ